MSVRLCRSPHHDRESFCHGLVRDSQGKLLSRDERMKRIILIIIFLLGNVFLYPQTFRLGFTADFLPEINI